MKIYKISPNNRKIVPPPYLYEGDGITQYMVRLPTNRHWRRVYIHTSIHALNGKGRTLYRALEDTEFKLPESFYYVLKSGDGANFIPIEFIDNT